MFYVFSQNFWVLNVSNWFKIWENELEKIMVYTDNKIRVYFDCETTGKDMLNDRIVSVGIVVARGRTVIDKYYVAVNPERKNTNAAYEIHKLSDDFLAKQPTFDKVAFKVLDMFIQYGQASTIAHNADFDACFFSQELLRLQKVKNIPIFEYIKNKYPDFIPERNRKYYWNEEEKEYQYTGKPLKDTEQNEFSLKDLIPIEDSQMAAFNFIRASRVSLDALAKDLDVDISERAEAHDALIDTMILMNVYQTMYERLMLNGSVLDKERDFKGFKYDKERDFLNKVLEQRVSPDLSNQLISLKAKETTPKQTQTNTNKMKM